MATSWTDLTLYTGAEALAGLSALFDGLDVTVEADYNFQVDTKRDFERFIKEMYYGTGKLTSTATDDFDIEEIENGSILNATALDYNNILVAFEYLTDLDDPSDKFGSYYANRYKRVKEQMNMDFKQLTFALPEGVNQLTVRSTQIVF